MLGEEKVNEQMSKEEIAARRKELLEFYKSETPLVLAQLKYEEAITKIEVAKMQRFEIMMMKAQMMEKPEERVNENNLKPEPNEGLSAK
jgi:hypothetical protein